MSPSPRFTLGQLAKLTGASLFGDPSYEISSVADLKSASLSDASFLANPRYTHLLSTTSAGVICIDINLEPIAGKNFLITDDPSRAFQQIAEAFFGALGKTGFTGIHPTAVVHETAQLGEGVQIGPYAVIDAKVVIGKNTIIDPHCSIGPGTQIGKECHLHSHSIVREHCSLGDRVILQPGAVVGSCGFGYTTSPTGVHTKLKQIGNVILEDDVEIGANATIDRARFKTTRVGRGSKIDNLVQVAHNVEIGEENIIAAQTGLAGSAKTGRGVMMGGQVGILGHIKITDFTMIATRGGVGKSINKSGKYAGSPVLPLAEHNRLGVHKRKLIAYAKQIEELEKRLAALEASLFPTP